MILECADLAALWNGIVEWKTEFMEGAVAATLCRRTPNKS